jgi:hypothetical protein
LAVLGVGVWILKILFIYLDINKKGYDNTKSIRRTTPTTIIGKYIKLFYKKNK